MRQNQPRVIDPPLQAAEGASLPWARQLLTFLPLVVVFILSLAHPLDPDLGWHLKYGEYFSLHHAMPPGNTFSAEMPGYPYINHAWGSDVLLYTVYSAFGFLGIIILGAAIMTATFACFSRAARLSFWEEAILFPVMLYLLMPIIEQSFRSQLLSLLGMGVLFLLLERMEKKTLSTLPAIVLLFFLWANGHGQFIVGLALYACWAGLYLLRAWLDARTGQACFPARAVAVIVATGVGAGLVSLLTPHGLAIYTEIARHAGNEFQQSINEWQPISLDPRLWWPFLAWGAVLAMGVVIIQRQQQLLAKAHFLIPALAMYVATFQQRRHFWPMVLISLPMAAAVVARLRPKRTAVAMVIASSLLAVVYLHGGLRQLPQQHIFAYSWDLYCRHLGCTAESADFLQQRYHGEALLTDYDWGGWLIWNYPAIKPAVDGRMPFWRDEQGYSAYGKYLALESGEADIDHSPYTVVYWSPNKEILFNRLSQLTAQGTWRQVYADPFASIFVRNRAR